METQYILLAIQAIHICWVSIINWGDLAARCAHYPVLVVSFVFFSERKWPLTRATSKAIFGKLTAFFLRHVAIQILISTSRPGLPKNNEAYYFFKIPDGSEDEFRQALKTLVDNDQITTAEQALSDRASIAEHKHNGGTDSLEVVGVNISFCPRGLRKVRNDGPANTSKVPIIC